MTKTSKPKRSSRNGSGGDKHPPPRDGSSGKKATAAPAKPRRPAESRADRPHAATTDDHVAAPDPGFDADASLLPGYDLDVDEAVHVAPIGPTESAQVRFLDSDSTEREPRSVKEIEQEMRALEARLDSLIHEREKAGDGAGEAPPAAELERAAEQQAAMRQRYVEAWGRTAIRERSEEVDEYGLDRAFEAQCRPMLDFLHRFYFRVETEGVARIPDRGRCIIVANHSGGPIPYDGLMLRTIVRREHPAQREVRWLSEDFIYYLPFAGTFMTRLGAVRACPENAERLLAKESALAVFPEGEKGVGKLFAERYRLQRFGRGGFIRLSLRTQAPIIPVAIVGAEESNPLLYKFETIAKVFGIPYVPVTPTFPALGAAGLLPAPTKWRVSFGDPITLSEYGPRAADDDILVTRLSELVRGTIQGMLDRMVASRRSVWLG